MDELGIYGKLPAHGDFIHRNLSTSILSPWDEWLQRCIESSKETLGHEWLDIYLTSPIWRFCLSPGVVDEHSWAGILVPSVDSVGRYFPLTIAVPVAENTNMFLFQTDNELWFSRLEEAALSALQNILEADELMEALRFAKESFVNCPALAANPLLAEGAKITVGRSADIRTSYPNILHDIYTERLPSYSVWWSQGSQAMPATNFICPSLPEVTNEL